MNKVVEKMRTELVYMHLTSVNVGQTVGNAAHTLVLTAFYHCLEYQRLSCMGKPQDPKPGL